MNKNKSQIGSQGETLAVEYLKKKGYVIIERNFRLRQAEIDIIARIGNIICFVEVKTRKSESFGLPEEFVNKHKINKIIRAAQVYLAAKKMDNMQVRFDIVSVLTGEGNKVKITHIEDFAN